MNLPAAADQSPRPAARRYRIRALLAAAALVAPMTVAATGESSAVAPDASDARRVSITSEPWGSTADGTEVVRYTMANANGMRVSIITYGGIIQSLQVPDTEGRSANVVLGYDNLADYLARNPFFGATIGRYANRIANGSFTLDGTTYQLNRNDGPNTLHGGPQGFDKKVWRAFPFAERGRAGVVLRYRSVAGEMGFPGTLDVQVTYTLTRRNQLRMDYEASTDAPTVVNLTNHAYFNLEGEGTGSTYDHLLRIDASAYTPVDDELIPTGEIAPVAGTPFDFNTATPIGARIRDDDPQLAFARGYDHNWVLEESDGSTMRRAARAVDPDSGRVLVVSTTEPGLQFYSGNFLNGSIYGTSGQAYRQGDAFTLETQHFPDSPNQPSFPSTVLRPGEEFSSSTIYRFAAR